MTLVRLEPTAPSSGVKHSTTEPLHSLTMISDYLACKELVYIVTLYSASLYNTMFGVHRNGQCYK